jgi:epoxyqueuosine reductase QueG
MVERIRELLKNENIQLCVFYPLEKCIITKGYLLERAGIDSGFAVIFAIPYYTRACEERRNISAYAVSRDYHRYIKELEERILRQLRDEYPGVPFAMFADHSPIDERDAAVRGGLGIYGKNRLIITKEYSSYVFIGELIVGAPLPEGSYTDKEPECCEDCGACQRLCPWLCGESDECLSAMTQKKGELTDKEKELIKKYGAWGCDICTEVCPHTKKAKEAQSIYSPIEFFNKNATPYLTYEEIEAMSDEEFSQRAYSWRGRETILRNLRSEKS